MLEYLKFELEKIRTATDKILSLIDNIKPDAIPDEVYDNFSVILETMPILVRELNYTAHGEKYKELASFVSTLLTVYAKGG